MPRDVVISFYATPSKNAAVMQPVSLFQSPPHVMGVSPSGKSGSNPSWQLAKTSDGRTLPPLLAQAKKQMGDAPARVAIVGFSAGCSALRQLLAHPADRAAIDAVLPIDGMHFGKPLAEAQVAPYLEYGKLTASGSHLFALLHTAITPGNAGQIYSTTESASILFDRLQQAIPDGGSQQGWSEGDLMKGPPPPAVTVQNPIWGKDGKVAKYESVVYESVPPMSTRLVGNSFFVGMPGTRPADHIFAANWGQRALWQTFLAPRWNGRQGSAFSFFGSLPGGIDTTYLSPHDYDEDGQGAEEDSGPGAGTLLGLLALAGVGYAAYKWGSKPRRRR